MMNAAWEKLLGATLALTTADPIKQRLIRSFSEYLQNVDPGELPREVRASLRDLLQRLSTARPLPGESAVAATVRKMSNPEIEACARAIVELFAQYCALPQAAPAEATATVVALYSTHPEGVPALLAVNQA